MDPNFFFSVNQLSQQRQAAQTIAARLHQEEQQKRHQAAIQNFRRQLLADANSAASSLQQSLELEPEWTFVRVNLILGRMDSNQCGPDSFEDLKDKEDAILTWRLLLNLREKLQAQLSPAQLERCQNCLRAIHTKYLIEVAEERLEGFHRYEALQVQIAAATQARRRLLGIRFWAWLGIGLVTGLSFLAFAFFIGFEPATVYLLVWILASGLAAFAVHLYIDRRMPQEMDLWIREAEYMANEAGIEDEGFWEAVREQFNGLPTQEAIQEALAEQDVVIEMVYVRGTRGD